MTPTKNDFAPNLELLDLLPALWDARKIIGICVAGALLVSAVLAFVLPVTYESEAGLLLLPPPFKENKDGMSGMVPKVLSVPDYEILIHNDGTLVAAVKKVKEDAAKNPGVWDEDSLEALDELSSLRDRMYITTEVTEKNVTSMKYSPVIRLTARADTPERAQQLAQAWAIVSEEMTRELYLKGKSGLKDFMQDRFEVARDELKELNAEIRDIEIEWNDELEGARLGKKHTRRLEYEEKQTDAMVRIAATKEELASLEAAFAQETETLTLWKSPPMEAVFMQGAAGGRQPAPKADRAPGYEEEVLNQTYFNIESKLVEKRAELKSMEEYYLQMAEAIDELDVELQDLRRESAVRSYERRMLDLQVDQIKSSYDLLSEKLFQAKIAESEEQSTLTDLKIVAEAQVPDKKVSPPRTLIMLAASMLAFCGACAFVVLRALLERGRAVRLAA
jgi:uncharacterized protein involved in exopolysaccharide biosynthesis